MEWLDRLAPKATGHRRRGHVRHLRRHSRHAGQSDRRHGRAGLPRLELALQSRTADRVRPGCPVQPDNMSETLLYLLYQVAGSAPMIPLDDKLRPKWLFGMTVHDGCDRGGYYEEGKFAHEYGSPECLVKIGCWGPVVKCNVTKRGWMDGVGGCPNVGGICIACTMPGFPGQIHAVHGRAAGQQALHRNHRPFLRADDPSAARHHAAHRGQGTEVAAPRDQLTPAIRPPWS